MFRLHVTALHELMTQHLHNYFPAKNGRGPLLDTFCGKMQEAVAEFSPTQSVRFRS